jgi:hypothetical protein
MKQLVIMPGGFHPFHAGHLALYQSALQAFPGADVKVAATNDTSTRPFPFKLKEKLAQLAGVPPGDFYQVKSPFRADEITRNYDPADTQLIFVRSKKDADKPPVPGGIKRDGNPAYLQPISRNMAPMTQHAYMAYLPTVTFGPGMQSATEIRTAWPELDERRRTALVMSLYPHTQKNPKLAKTVVKMLDTAMGTELTEVLDTKAGKSNHAHWNASDPDMIKFTFTASNGVEYQLDFLEPYIGPDEMSPYDFFDSDEVYNKSKFVSFEQITQDMKGGYPVTKQGIEGTGSAAEVFGIVVNAIIQYVKKARPALLYFQAAEPNRRALYARMIRRILPGLPGWASTADDAGQFAIYNRRAIKSAMGTQAQDVTESHRIVTELRNTMYQYIKSIAPKWPDYVVRDWLYKGRGKNKNYNINSRDIKNEIIEMISDAGLTPDTQWQLVPDMKFTMDMFDPMTKQRLIGRAGGHSDLGMGIPRDKERHATQAALAQQQGGIRKEPVILIKTAKGYELLEGWHRTIQHFAKYPEGYTGPAWVAVAQGMNEATGDERFDSIMSRIRQEPAIPDPQMPPTDVKDLYQWAVKHHKPYHKIFAHWAMREGYKSVAPALQKAGNLDSDALDYWTPDVWKLWFGPGAEMPHHWSKERVPDELRDYLETVFDAYENIWQDWPTEYRQIGDRGVAEAFDNPYKTKTEKSEYGDVDMLAKLPDGTNLSIMFNHEGDNEWQVEFYRDNSQEVTGQGDSQRIFATVLAAIQKFVKKYQPDVIKFSAEKSNNSDSRSSLYDRLVSRFAQQLGYNDYSEEYMSSTMYELSKQSQGMDEEVTRQMSQGGLRASYQDKYNQPMMEDYLDEARS